MSSAVRDTSRRRCCKHEVGKRVKCPSGGEGQDVAQAVPSRMYGSSVAKLSERHPGVSGGLRAEALELCFNVSITWNLLHGH